MKMMMSDSLSLVLLMLCLSLMCNSQQLTNADQTNENDLELDLILEKIFAPAEQSSMQVRALRNDLVRRLYDALAASDADSSYQRDEDFFKRSYAHHFPAASYVDAFYKRNLAALAKGGYIRTIPDEEQQEEEEGKRSLATLVKNGQLPMASVNNHHHVADDDQKRGVPSLLRNRIVTMGKRNIAALAREGLFGGGKRNVAALLRQVKMHTPISFVDSGREEAQRDQEEQNEEAGGKGDEKRNIGSIKAQQGVMRKKRDIDYGDEFAVPVYQNQNVRDYEELIKALTGEYPMEKRFLGSVAKSGWFSSRQPSGGASTIEGGLSKRHIGSLARLGWLPTLRTIRRFNRSGRSFDENNCDCRETTADGQTENDAVDAKVSVSSEAKRYLVQPLLDKLILEKYLKQKYGTED